ncbi:BnaC04g23990D [Brassica napus]|uniref:BnaC04g23990D protein n=1 Tax=Brassica napus TaxID=3708 RepID=A0A078IC11_BRANA|nr:BnaC04g23990D [Brassica napus]
MATSTAPKAKPLFSVQTLDFREIHSPSVLHFPSSKFPQKLFCLLDVSAASFVSCSRMGSCIYRLRLTVTFALHFPRRCICGAPEREPDASIDACLSHLGECLTELAYCYSLDGPVNASCQEAVG